MSHDTGGRIREKLSRLKELDEKIAMGGARIKELEEENARLKERWKKHQGTVVHDHAFTTVSERGELKKQIHELKIENTRLREEIKTWEKALYSYKAHYPNFEVLKEKLALLDNFTPTNENINRLPEPIRKFIHELETRCDPAGDTAELILTRDINKRLQEKLADLQNRINRCMAIDKCLYTDGCPQPCFGEEADE